MNKKILFAAFSGVLLVSSLSFSQEARAEKQPVDPNSVENEMITEIVRTQYFPSDDLERFIKDIFRIGSVYSDRRSNQLVIKTKKKQMKDIAALIAKLDIPGSGLATTGEALNVISRIYMFEVPSKNADMKPFSMILQTTDRFSSTELLKAAKSENLQISEFHLDGERHEEQQKEILIQGRAVADESVKEMVDSIPGARVKELEWSDCETFTQNIAAAQYTQLTEQLQKHIRKFLGDNIQTVGYWFGNSSVPGEIEAPIGPWKLGLSLEKRDSNVDLRINVGVPEGMSDLNYQLGDYRRSILSNTMTTKIGKPIIIGYNRQSYGTRKMGAMVILLEEDTVQLSIPQASQR
jgi:hypothetical protein